MMKKLAKNEKLSDEELASTLDARRSAEAEAVLVKDEGIMKRISD